jgi:hypothetical protein
MEIGHISTIEGENKDQGVIKYDKEIMGMCVDYTNTLNESVEFKEMIEENDINIDIVVEMFYELYKSPSKIKKIVNIFDKDEYDSIILHKTRNLIDLNDYCLKYRCNFFKIEKLYCMCQFVVKHGTYHFLYDFEKSRQSRQSEIA